MKREREGKKGEAKRKEEKTRNEEVGVVELSERGKQNGGSQVAETGGHVSSHVIWIDVRPARDYYYTHHH